MYSAVNVYNPTSKNHTAFLQPGQELQVTFHNVTIMDECGVDVLSDLVELSQETYSNSGKTFVFKQKYDLERWADISTTYLGQIYFSGRGKTAPSVSMYLSPTNEIKRDIVTTVNPEGQTIKLYPHQILEVVTYTPIWEKNLVWSYEKHGYTSLELIANVVIDPTVYKITESDRTPNDAFYTYPRMLQHSGVPYLECHWWYRWGEIAANLAKSFECPAVPITFVGHVKGQVKTKQTVKVAINERIKPRWQEARSFQVTYEDSAMDVERQEDYNIQPFIMPTLRTDHNLPYHSSKKRHHKNRNHKNQGHSVNPRINHQDSNYHRHKPYVRQLQTRDVMVRLKPEGSLESGCRLVSDDPIETVKPPALPAPHKPNQDKGYSSFRSKSQFIPPKAAYYYDGPDEQWD